MTKNSKLNATIKKVTDDIEKRFNFNTAISSIMELVNELYKYKQGEDLNTPLLEDAITKLVTLLSPFTPHICEEMWHELGKEESLIGVRWPDYDESALVEDVKTIVIQINGKLKERLSLPAGLSGADLEEKVLEEPNVASLIQDVNVVKTIAVPDKLVNFVVK